MSEQNTSTSTGPEPIDLFVLFGNFLRVLRRVWLLVLLVAVGYGGLKAIASLTSYTPIYRAQAVLAANADTSSYGDLLGIGSYYSSTASTQQIISTFPSLLATDAMREQILQELDASYINGNISASSIGNSNLFTLTVTSGNPQDAYDILGAVVHCYPTVASRVLGSTTVEILDDPVVPTEPINQRSWFSSALRAALQMLIVELCIVALLAQARKIIRSPEQIKKISNMTCLAHVPRIKQKKRAHTDSNSLSLLNDKIAGPYQEAIRTARTRLLHATRKDDGQVIMITSTLPSEGKSTIAANLALSLAQAGYKVILIDADLRVQALREFFGLKPSKRPGLAELLRGQVTDPSLALQTIPGTRLQIISGSKPVSNPSHLLKSRRIQRLLSTLRPEADYILVDTPPIGLLSDASSIVTAVDGVLYVVREECVSRGQLVSALQGLADAGGKMYGYIFNAASEAGGQFGYGKYGYGKYGYGKYGKYGYGSYGRQKSAYAAYDSSEKSS